MQPEAKSFPAIARRISSLEMEVQHYRTRFTLEADKGHDALEAAIKVVHAWAKASCKGELKPTAELSASKAFRDGIASYPQDWHGNTPTDERFAFSTSRFDAGGHTAWAFEMDKVDGDPKAYRRRWHTRLGVIGDSHSVTVNVQITHRNVAGYFGGTFMPVPNVPNVIKDFMSVPGVVAKVGDIKITDHETVLDKRTFDDVFLMEFLNPSRELPIIVIGANPDGTMPISPKVDVAKLLMGMAKVYVVDFSNEELSDAWRSFFSKATATSWDYRTEPGTLRVYLAGLDLSSYNPRDTTYGFTKRQMVQNLSERNAKNLVGILVDGLTRTVGRRASDVLEVADVEWIRSLASSNRLRARMNSLLAKQEGHRDDDGKLPASSESGRQAADMRAELAEWQELAQEMEEDNEKLAEINKQLSDGNEQLQAQLSAVKSECDGLKYSLQQKESSKPELASQVALKAIPRTLADVLEYASELWSDRIAITDKAWKGAEEWNDDAGDVAEEYDIVRSVATVLYDLHSGARPVEGEFTECFKSLTGFELTHKEGAQTKKNKDMMRQRECRYNGKTYMADAHVKGRNSSIGFRLYYDWDDDLKLIVVGHCGNHLETTGSSRRGYKR